MLRALKVTDLALIEDLQLEFGAGLNVITGETGAGKSLLHRAVAIALGGRTGQEVVRAGRDAAQVEANFTLPADHPELCERIQARGVSLAKGELEVRRTVARSGRGQISLNGRSVPLAGLVEAGAALAQLQGQHESLRLAQAEAHLGMLDDFADTSERAVAYRAAYDELSHHISRLEALDRGAADLARHLEMVRYDLDELDAARIEDANEGEELSSERSRLRNVERLASTTEEALERLHGGENAALGAVESHAARLRELVAFDPGLEPLVSALEQAIGPLADGVHELQSYVHGLDADPQRLEAVEERLALLDRLQRKHAVVDVAGLVKKRAELAREIDQGEQDQSDPEALHRALAEAADQAWKQATELSRRRRAAASRLAKRMKQELAELGMSEASFTVEFQSLAPSTTRGPAAVLVRDGCALGPDGPLRAEFLLEANPGEGARPLARVASGGELSRLMLALRNVTGAGSVPTLVFDEVDAGIGGAAAEIVGRRLRALGERHQVVCITHLAQIAAFADQHYAVDKRRSGGRTRTRVQELEGEARVREIARMLGDADPGEEAVRHAAEMLARAGRAETSTRKPRRRTASARAGGAGRGAS